MVRDINGKFNNRGESYRINKKKALIWLNTKGFDDKKWGERNNLNAEENIRRYYNYGGKKVVSHTHTTHFG